MRSSRSTDSRGSRTSSIQIQSPLTICLQRVVDLAAVEEGVDQPAFKFEARPSPELFRTIKYSVNGKVKEAAFDDFLGSTDTTSFIVIKNDEILYERYFNGYRRDSIVTSFSIAKSVTSALIGIAIDEGFIGSVDDPIVDYLPELRNRGLDEISFRTNH